MALHEVRVLGPVAVADGETVMAIRARRQRAILAALALARGGVVSTDGLAEALWGDEPPDGVRGTLQSYVSRLRAAIGSEAIGFEPGGYRLCVRTDIDAVDDLAARGRSLAEHDPGAAATCFEEALGRWRGPALGDLADDAWFVPDAVRLAELRRSLVDDRISMLVRAGRAADVVGEAERATAAEPLRERTRLLLVEALAATGRTADALRSLNDYRRLLVDETGLDPGAELSALEQHLLLGTGPAPVVARRAAVLPRPGSLLGRIHELDELGRVIQQERLVTIVGPGGVGKTRLVAELLHHHRPTCALVELAGVAHDDVARAIAAGVGLSAAPSDPVGAAAEMLSVSPMLLVLDNAEHVASAVAAAARRLLDGAAGLRILVTSRVRLGLPEEHVFALGPLAWEGPDAPAVTLFLERLRRSTGGLAISDAHLADAQVLCERLDGIPLAVELAAGRAAALGTHELVRCFDDVLDLGVSDVSTPERHETLRAVVAWSYDLLSPADRELLDRVSIFEGDLTVGAVEAVVPEKQGSVPDRIARLVDASLLTALPDGRLRLLDTVRRFARERLEARPWAAEVRAAHAGWVATMLEEVAAAAAGSGDAAADARLRTHIDDVRAALGTCLANGDGELCERLARSLSTMNVYRLKGDLLAWPRRAAAELRQAGPAVRAAAARAAYLQGDLDDAKRWADGVDIAVAHHARGVVALYEGSHDLALDAFKAAVNAPDVDFASRLDATGGTALTLGYAGDLDAARVALRSHRLLAESAGSETYRAFADYVEGELALVAHDDRRAVELLEAAVHRARAVRADFIVGVASTALLSALVRLGDTRSALEAAVDLVDHWWSSATWPQQWTTLRLAAVLLAQADRPDIAMLVLDAAECDGSSPAVVGEDAARLAALRVELTEALGEPTVSTISGVANQLPRAVVVQRARQILAELASRASTA